MNLVTLLYSLSPSCLINPPHYQKLVLASPLGVTKFTTGRCIIRVALVVPHKSDLDVQQTHLFLKVDLMTTLGRTKCDKEYLRLLLIWSDD
jgi:hypothetical protein